MNLSISIKQVSDRAVGTAPDFSPSALRRTPRNHTQSTPPTVLLRDTQADYHVRPRRGHHPRPRDRQHLGASAVPLVVGPVEFTCAESPNLALHADNEVMFAIACDDGDARPWDLGE